MPTARSRAGPRAGKSPRPPHRGQEGSDEQRRRVCFEEAREASRGSGRDGRVTRGRRPAWAQQSRCQGWLRGQEVNAGGTNLLSVVLLEADLILLARAAVDDKEGSKSAKDD